MIYLDHASTTPIKSIALTAIEESPIGNPNSIHNCGIEAYKIIKKSERLVKSYINGDKGDIYWFSSASLANYFVISNSIKNEINDFICMETTHKSIRQFGNPNTMLKPLTSGLISYEELKLKITSETKLLSMLYVNNETGVIQPVNQIKDYTKNSLYHVDAVQAATKIPINVEDIKCDFLTMSGHKFGTPKGIACLWVKKGIHIDIPYLGTPPVSLIYSFAETLKFTDSEKDQKNIRNKSNFFKNTLNELSSLNNIELEYNVQTENTIPNIISIRFPNIDALSLLMYLSDNQIYVSIGSACNSSNIMPSYVLTSMGISSQDALSTIRISLSDTNSYDDLRQTANTLIRIITDIKNERS